MLKWSGLKHWLNRLRQKEDDQLSRPISGDPDFKYEFETSDFSCKCGCGQDGINPGVVRLLEDAVKHFGKPAKINSGVRCWAHNSASEGSSRSQHLFGNAIDFEIENTQASHVYRYFDTEYPNTLGLGRYERFTHIDVRQAKARW